MGNFDQVYVKEVDSKGKGIFAKQAIKKDSLVFNFIGTVLPLEEATTLSLQISEFTALESTCEIDDYLNHSCDPNCVVVITDDVSLYAKRDIEINEELSFDYNTTECDLVAQKCDFKCQCKSDKCLKWIKGSKYLPVKNMAW